ncbi:MAG: hypothetical protein IT454_19805 [Planctomycetes bacterium]|nr:hypothetical protein [Planctomycetota bacterium]
MRVPTFSSPRLTWIGARSEALLPGQVRVGVAAEDHVARGRARTLREVLVVGQHARAAVAAVPPGLRVGARALEQLALLLGRTLRAVDPHEPARESVLERTRALGGLRLPAGLCAEHVRIECALVLEAQVGEGAGQGAPVLALAQEVDAAALERGWEFQADDFRRRRPSSTARWRFAAAG